MSWVILAIGSVCLVEGLVLALAPSRIEAILKALTEMPVEARRLIGLIAIVVGVALVSLARGLQP